MSTELDPTRVLLDTENDFFGFGRTDPSVADARLRARERRQLLFPRMPDDVARCLAPLIVADLADWIEARWEPLARESYGKTDDPGVREAREPLEDRGFTHHPVPWGKDLAELALIDEMEAISARESGPLHMTLGGGDSKMLDAALRLHDADDRHRFVAIVCDSRSHRVYGARYARPGAMEITGVDLIKAEQRELRRTDPRARAAYRALCSDVFSRLRSWDTALDDRPTAMSTLGAAVVSISKMARFPHPISVPPEEWTARVMRALARLPDEAAALSIAGWAALEAQESPIGDEERLVEKLFLAAIVVTLGERMTGEHAALMRSAVRRVAPRRLTALERAIATWTTTAR